MSTEEQEARALAKFLTHSENYGDRLSPLDRIIRQHIRAMAKEIALEVIRGVPELAGLIREKSRELVLAALVDDAMLNRVVTESVAAGLGKLVSARRQGIEDSDT